ncbi:MAG: hypothetical protein Q9191_005965 [Dirinaria sp. TL-2023a]
MTSTELNLLAPLDNPLPPPPEGEVLTAAQWRTLLAIADAVIPSIEVSSTASKEKLTIQASEYASAVDQIQKTIPVPTESRTARNYLQESASSTPGFKESIHRRFGHYMREDALKGIRVVLSALDTRAGCLLTTGSTTSFHLQPVETRQQILQSWSKSYVPALRQTAKSLCSLCIATWSQHSTTLGPVLGFPKVPVHGKPGKGFEYSFIQFPPSDQPEVLETDVVIVGSGCGGGVCAKNFAEAGHRVMVVEKAYHYPPEHLPMSEADAQVHLFMNGGMEMSDDNSIAVIAGQAWGGGGTVNWSASLQTQGYVREEWADAGLPFFTSSAFQNCLDRVCGRMGVSTDYVEHGTNNHMLHEGSRRLGYGPKIVPQNTGGNKHYCGYCTLGCGSAEKQGPMVSFLPDAARAGAHFIEGFDAEKVLFKDIQGKKTAVGIKGLWRSRDTNGGVSGSDKTTRSVVINAKRVIVSCGSLQSPLLLLRSGLTNPQIGRNLHLHPVTIIGATYPQPTLPWEGGILTSLTTAFENLDSAHHGTKLEVVTMLPSWVLPFLPWEPGLDYKLWASKFSHMTGHIALVRDKNTGRVYPDPVDGRCRIAYTPGKFERQAAMEGCQALAKIAYEMGATEIFGTVKNWPRYVRAAPQSSTSSEDSPAEDVGINDPDFQSFLASIRRLGLNPPDAGWGTAHQMGTCRMSSSEKGQGRQPGGVVDPSGQVWGVEGLFVADASVFPSASGVNPMVTNMALSDWISRGVARGLKEETSKAKVEARL